MQSAEPRLLPWRTEFADRALEKTFKTYWQAGASSYLRVTFVIAMIIVALTSYGDYLRFPSGVDFWLLLAVRVLFVVSAAWLISLLGRRPEVVTKSYPTAGLAILFATVFLVHMGLSGNPISDQLLPIGLLIFGIGMLFPTTISYSAAVHAFIAAGCIGIALLQHESGADLGRIIAIIGLASGLCLAMGRATHVTTRMQFLLHLQAEQTNEQLRKEIARREQLEAELKRLATTDGLTGLNNRRHFLELAGQQFRLIHRTGEPLSVCMLDVDHFKAVNDTHGHQIGDEALKAVASACLESLRETDIVGRYGGEEFVILLPATNLAGARTLTERLREAIARIEIPVGNDTLRITATIGIAACWATDADIEAGLKRADAALYQGKHDGRDRVSACEESLSASV